MVMHKAAKRHKKADSCYQKVPWQRPIRSLVMHKAAKRYKKADSCYQKIRVTSQIYRGVSHTSMAHKIRSLFAFIMLLAREVEMLC